MRKLTKNVVVIGGGNMGSLIAIQLVKSKVISNTRLCVVDPNLQQRNTLRRKLGVKTFAEARDIIGSADIVILAVKPQQSDKLASQIKNGIPKNALLLSIMAGVNIDSIVKQYGHTKVVRAMPNIAARVGMSMTTWYARPVIAKKVSADVTLITDTLGSSLAVNNESLIDAATAVAGSGPAYWYATAEAHIIAARKLGFTNEQASDLVSQTFLGAAKLYEKGSVDLSELRESVTSKGGTTASALNILKRGRFTSLWEKAIKAAFKRAKELSL